MISTPVISHYSKEVILQAAKKQGNSFSRTSEIPIVELNMDKIRISNLEAIKEQYSTYGYCVIKLSHHIIRRETILSLAELLNLGPPFLPPLYVNDHHSNQNITRISYSYNQDHPSFHKCTDIPLHTDGTLQKIGMIKTSIIACSQQGSSGGENTIFHATEAFANLILKNFEAASTLLLPGTLIRKANINNSHEQNILPVFSIQDDELFSAYSITKTDSFQPNAFSNPKKFFAALKYLRIASCVGSSYYREIRLQEGYVLLLANHKLSHGRKKFLNSQNHERLIYRALFLNRITV